MGQKLSYRSSGGGSGRGVPWGRSCGIVPAAGAAGGGGVLGTKLTVHAVSWSIFPDSE